MLEYAHFNDHSSALELQEREAGYQRQDSYAATLHRRLGRVASASLPLKTINGILDLHFPDWEYRDERVGKQQISFLQRKMTDSLINVAIPEPKTSRQSIYKSNAHLALIIEDEVRGHDLRYLIRLEQRYRIHTRQREAAGVAILSPRAEEFRKAQHDYVNEDDPFTHKQAIALSLTTHHSSREEIAQALGVTQSSITKLLLAARERVNVTSGGYEAYIELMMIAIALGIANIDHVPKGRTEMLEQSEDRELLRGYYSPDPEKRAAVRRWPPTALASRWSRIPGRLGLDTKNRHAAVLFAIRDEILPLPDRATIEATVERYLKNKNQNSKIS